MCRHHGVGWGRAGRRPAAAVVAPGAAVVAAVVTAPDSLGDLTSFQALVEHLSDVVTVVDPDGVILYQSRTIADLLGRDASTMIGTALGQMVSPDEAVRLEAALGRALSRPGMPVVVEVAIEHRDGGWRDTEIVVTDLLDVPGVNGVVLSIRDVTERRQLHDRLTHQAYYDALTGLANRSLFQRELAASLPSAAPGSVAILFCDLDGFKAVNDSRGHDVGDALLGVVAERLRSCVRPADVVARFGGDEFAVLVRDVDAVQHAQAVAARISSSLAAPIRVDGSDVRVGVSIGIAAVAAGSDSIELLLRNADLAMYRAKAHRRDSVVLFEPLMQDVRPVRHQAEADLGAALERGQLALHYQPTVALASGITVGVEALMRWYHPRRGVVAPDDFIDLAVETGFIDRFGEWALFEACRQGASWQDHAQPGTVFSVGVNISARQLTTSLVDVVSAALTDSGMHPNALLLEVTESALVGDVVDVAGVLRSLKRLGVRLAVDDVRSGFADTSLLAGLPVDVVKLDKEVIDAIDGEKAEVAREVVQLCRSLGIAVIAEGVERQAQCQELRAVGCAFGQGYLFSRPLPATGVTALLSQTPQDGGHPPQDRRVVAVDR